ncbi:MAG: fructose-6-phosphate aldolase [candidate division WOR-3 bacterium]|nr:fructose-6-phosphate aldolase [candidate division WOR-3 bacterium]MCX7837416.1 fructose-6-phosphate aldolase [candidate division WOR-3 bacterium]MDW8113806.1 fructose-6-phosphate aldolase [candidate division WOR-3 bacterium]
MKIFIDSADINEIREVHSWGILDGVTTNPTLIAKTGKKFDTCIREIVELVKGPISVEVISSDWEGMVKEARELAKYGEWITIKIPMSKDGLKAVKILSEEKIKTNMTLVFSPNQAILAAKAGATFVSPFVGRLDDISHFGMEIISDIVQIYKNYNFKTEIIVASVRNPLHVVTAGKLGAHIVTCPYQVLELMIKHPLTDIGIKKFLEDYQKIPK